jgi:hypothetical protein
LPQAFLRLTFSLLICGLHIFAYREHGILRSVNTYFHQP